jgi:hypothetical protein
LSRSFAHGLVGTEKDRPYVEPDTAVLENLERQKQIRHHTRRLREMGADAQTINMLTEKLLTSPPEPSAEAHSVSGQSSGDSPAQDSASQKPPSKPHCIGKRPIARGALGFRIRTAPKKRYSVEKDPSTGAPPQGRPKTKTKDKTKTKAKTKT